MRRSKVKEMVNITAGHPSGLGEGQFNGFEFSFFGGTASGTFASSMSQLCPFVDVSHLLLI